MLYHKLPTVAAAYYTSKLYSKLFSEQREHTVNETCMANSLPVNVHIIIIIIIIIITETYKAPLSGTVQSNVNNYTQKTESKNAKN